MTYMEGSSRFYSIIHFLLDVHCILAALDLPNGVAKEGADHPKQRSRVRALGCVVDEHVWNGAPLTLVQLRVHAFDLRVNRAVETYENSTIEPETGLESLRPYNIQTDKSGEVEWNLLKNFEMVNS